MLKKTNKDVINRITNTSIVAIALFALPLNVIIYFALQNSEFLIPRFIPPAISVVVIVMALLRKRVRFDLKMWLFIALLFITGCFNLLLGLLDTASLWFILAIIFTLFIAQKKEALLMFFASFVVILATGMLMMIRTTVIPLDYGFDNCHFACVAVRIIHFLLIGYLVYYILNIFFLTINDNVKELSKKTTDLERTNQALKTEMEAKKMMQQEMLETIILTEEKERKRIASDLHDGFGPVLSAINFFFQAYLDAGEEEKKSIKEKLQTVIDNAISDVSRIAHHISPYVLENQGLIPALENFSNHISVDENIRFDLNLEPVGRFDLKKELTLYRTLTELISNTLKHSGATTITIEVFTRNDTLHVTYKDNGKGFDPNMPEDKKGMGLTNVANRIRSLKGTIAIKSPPLEGMLARIEIPYQNIKHG